MRQTQNDKILLSEAYEHAKYCEWDDILAIKRMADSIETEDELQQIVDNGLWDELGYDDIIDEELAYYQMSYRHVY